MQNKKNLLFSVLTSAVMLLSSTAVFAQGADTTPPADIERAPTVVAVGNGVVTLQWDVTTDNVGVTGYKVYYGTTSLAEQQNGNTNGSNEYAASVKVDNVNQTTVSNLTNDTKYYFAVTALDAAGNESEYYSPEVAATPTVNGAVMNGNENSAAMNENVNAMMADNSNSAADNSQNTANLTAKEDEKGVILTWTAPTDAAVIDQVLSVSKDGGSTYDDGVHLGKDLTSYTWVQAEAGTAYTFKLTTKNDQGTETVVGMVSLTTAAESDVPTGKDVMNLVAKFERVMSKYTVMLTWDLPSSVTDVVAQLIYQSLDGNVFTQLASLEPTIREYQVRNLAAGKYFFKITTKDQSGKESTGVIKMVELPASGPALVLVGLASLFGTGVVMKKKKK